MRRTLNARLATANNMMSARQILSTLGHRPPLSVVVPTLRNRLLSAASQTTSSDTRNTNISTIAASPSAYVSGSSTHFGFENVDVQEKEERVRQVFENVAESYDVMNDVMSAGMHRLWKDAFVDQTAIAPMARIVRNHTSDTESNDNNDSNVTLRCLDVAGGTGDIAFRMVDAALCLERSKSSGKDPISVTVCDINPEMLRVGERRARERYGSALLDGSCALKFCEGNAQALNNFNDNTFDLYTISFGLRNVTDVDRGLSEAYRVLKPGGRFLCLEFSHLPNAALQHAYDTYSFNVIPAMGELVASDRDSYQYLVESIRKFPKQDELVARIERAGFQKATYTNMTGGIVAIHEGWKPLQ